MKMNRLAQRTSVGPRDAKQASARRIDNARAGIRAGIGMIALASLLAASSVACGGRTTLLAEDAAGGGVSEGGAASGAGGGGTSSGNAGSGGHTSGSGGGGAAGALAGGGSGGALERPLWRRSVTPFCQKRPELVDRLDVWSDGRGVFVLVGAAYAEHTIYFNDGNGWNPYFHTQQERGLAALTGFQMGPLVEYGTSGCAIQFLEDGTRRCSGAPSSAQHVFTVDLGLAYSVYEDRLLHYDGLLWRQLGGPLVPTGIARARAVWADRNSVFVVGDAGLLSLSTDGVMKPIPRPNAPAVNYVSAWGFAASDLWAGGTDGQLAHYDGTRWSTAARASGDCSTILGMWGDSGTLYYHTRNAVGVHSGGHTLELMSWPCGGPVTVESLWGTSASEVFTAMHNADASTSECAGSLMWFDGKSFSAL
jgi:hypothetical protein